MAASPTRHVRAARRLSVIEGNPWEFVISSIKNSPAQPVADVGFGNVESNPPQILIDAHNKALNEVDNNQYSPPMGMHSFREAISKFYSSFYDRRLDVDQEISIHTGGTQALLSCFAAFIEPGDEILLFEPAFDLYWRQAMFFGAQIKSISLHVPEDVCGAVSSSDDWKVDMDRFESAITSRTKILVLNSPHNPLGKVFTSEELVSIGDICVKHNILIISDEVFEFMHFTPNFPRLAAQSESISRQTMTVSSIGKAFNALGWRLGFVIGPARLIEHVKRAHIILGYTSPSPAQAAAAAVLRHADVTAFFEANRRSVKANIERLSNVLDEIGLSYVRPSGAIFIFVNIANISIPAGYTFPDHVQRRGRDWKICWLMTQEIGLATIPGSAFYANSSTRGAEDFVRLSICKDHRTIDLAVAKLRRLRDYIKK